MDGIGACSKALERLGIEYEIADYVEIDKYAAKSFNAIHGTNFELQDICEWNKDIEVDLIMHGSPCQDFSLAGKQSGGDIGSGTRSSLMYETIRIVEKLRPKYVIWENVKNLLSKKHKHNFDAYLDAMKELGYTNYYQVLNAKDYGIPQNRERIFTVSILGNENYDFPKGDIQECEVINPLKDISGKSWQFEQNVYSENSILRSLKAGGGSGNIPKVIEHFEFPPKQELKLKLKDMLEDEVDEKYYLSTERLAIVNKNLSLNNECDYVIGSSQKHASISYDGICPTLTSAMGLGGGQTPMIPIKDNKCIQESQEMTKELLEQVKSGKYPPNIAFGTYLFQSEHFKHEPTKELATTIKSSKVDCGTILNLRIRKLTPKECWRLMGFDDKDFEKAEKVNSNTQLYKQARKFNSSKCIRSYIKEFIRSMIWIQVIYYFQNQKTRKKQLQK